MPRQGPVPLVAMEGISKSFGGVRALQGANLSVQEGEVHALLGENGAGKSTLIKILGGALPRDAGTVAWEGRPLEMEKPADATAAGIRVIHQHLTVVDHLTVAENLVLGTERARFGFIDRREARSRAAGALGELGVSLNLDHRVGDLRLAEKQLVEIARAIGLDARLLVMDEPTASLGDREVEHLFQVIGGLRERGIAVIYISHRLDEVLRVADRITVLRDGRTVGSVGGPGVRREQLVQMMVGRQGSPVAREPVEPGPVILSAENLSTDTGLSRISLDLRAGEIVGVYGLLGSGRTELARALCGADRLSSGVIRVNGRRVDLASPRDGRGAGVGLIPEDRTAQALLARLSVRENLTSASEDLISTFGWIRSRTERHLAEAAVDDLGPGSRLCRC